MKKTTSVGLGGRNFIIDEDAYSRLDLFLNKYEASLKENRKEVMEELEMRIADLLREKTGDKVVDMKAVEEVMEIVGLPDPEQNPASGQSNPDYENNRQAWDNCGKPHRFYRDVDNRKIGGVCSGLAIYLGIDVVLVRILAVVLLICGSFGLWIYLIICLVAPAAYSAVQKCELHGLPCTPDNISKFTNTYR